jgi:hypothetical protein
MRRSESRRNARIRTRFPLLVERGEDKCEESTNNKSLTEGNVDITRGLHQLAVRRDKL